MKHSKKQQDQINFDHLKRSNSQYREMSPRNSNLKKPKIGKDNEGNLKFSISKFTSSIVKKLTKGALDFINSRSKSREKDSNIKLEEEQGMDNSGCSTPDFKSRKPSFNSSILNSREEKSILGEISNDEKEIKGLMEEVKLISDSKKNLTRLFNNHNTPILHELNLEKGRRLDEISRKSQRIQRSRSKLKKYKKNTSQDLKSESDGRGKRTLNLEDKRSRFKLETLEKNKLKTERLIQKVLELNTLCQEFLEGE